MEQRIVGVLVYLVVFHLKWIGEAVVQSFMVSLLAALVCGLQSSATLTERDRDVITAYVLSYNEASKEAKERDWVMQVNTSGSLHELCMKALREQMNGKPELGDLTKSLQERNTSPVRLDTLPWKPNILLFDLFQKKQTERFLGTDWQFYKVFQRGVSALQPELPGYTSDGKTAVLLTWIGPNHIHSIHEVSLLNLKDGKWSVTWRKLTFYL